MIKISVHWSTFDGLKNVFFNCAMSFVFDFIDNNIMSTQPTHPK